MRRRELTPEYSPAGTMRPRDAMRPRMPWLLSEKVCPFCDRMDSVCSVGGAHSICFIGTLGSTALGVAELLASTLAASVPDENNFG